MVEIVQEAGLDEEVFTRGFARGVAGGAEDIEVDKLDMLTREPKIG